MKTLQNWYEEYGESHKNQTNKAIHYWCVPAIYFSVIGLLIGIPNGILSSILNANLPILENWAFVAFLFVFVFYVRLSLAVALKMAVFTLVCMVINLYLGNYFNLSIFSISLFSLAWIGQFYGHKIEGKKPSFLKDLQFLLIGPAWVADQLFKRY